MSRPLRKDEDERAPQRKEGTGAPLDELGDDPRQVGARSAGQSADSQRLSIVRDSSEESVEELEDADQNLEAASVEGIEDAADHPERATHTHIEYGRPDDLAPRRQKD